MISHRDAGNLKRHVRLMHEARKDPIHCPRTWCRKEFFVHAEMRRHKAKCLKVCPDCMKTFPWLNKYEAHLRGHMKKKERMV